MTMPLQKRGSSRQNYRTPPAFLSAVARQFGPIAFDLACSRKNAVAPRGFTAQQDAIKQDWAKLGLTSGEVAWCNPPFANLKLWTQAAWSVRELARWTLVLVPYSGSAVWWQRFVLGKAHIFGIPRLTFVGCKDPYPKDLAVLAYGFGVAGVGYWDWRQQA